MLALHPQRMPVTTTQEFSNSFRLVPVVFSINWSFSDRRYYSFYKITHFIWARQGVEGEKSSSTLGKYGFCRVWSYDV